MQIGQNSGDFLCCHRIGLHQFMHQFDQTDVNPYMNLPLRLHPQLIINCATALTVNSINYVLFSVFPYL